MDFYVYQRPVGKIDDDFGLRNSFVAVFDTKSKIEAVKFGLLYGQHLLDITGLETVEEIRQTFAALQRWLDKKTNYFEARSISYVHLLVDAKFQKDIIRQRFYKTMSQITCIPHVKFHALWASDMAITLTNKMYPNDFNEVKKERTFQIELFQSVKE